VVTASNDNTAKIWGSDKALIKEYFSNKRLPLSQQALLVTLDGLSKQNNGGPIRKSDIIYTKDTNSSAFRNVSTLDLFTGIPPEIVQALKNIYKLSDDIFSNLRVIEENPPSLAHALGISSHAPGVVGRWSFKKQ
jgi:hypothetical protein